MLEIKTWRFINTTSSGSAGWNMAVDEALLERFKDTDIPILRLYKWEKSLSFGRFSKPDKSLNMDRVNHSNLPCVRRLSGGGILVHGGDISYSLILPRHLMHGQSVRDNYHHLCQFLIRLYEKLGCKADFASELGIESQSSKICLAGHEPYDIVVKGHKMGGNAQRYSHNTLLQHGSIPMRIDEMLFEPFFFTESGLKDAGTLEKFGIIMSDEILSEIIADTFCETYRVNLIKSVLTPDEENHAQKLLNKKYLTREWTLDGK